MAEAQAEVLAEEDRMAGVGVLLWPKTTRVSLARFFLRLKIAWSGGTYWSRRSISTARSTESLDESNCTESTR